MTETEMLDRAARAQGWIDFPSDSVEMGSRWHMDAQRAPFGPAMNKSAWRPFTNLHAAFELALALRITIDMRNFTVLCKRWEGSAYVDRVIEYYADHAVESLAVCRAIVRCAAGDASSEAEYE